MGSSFKTDCLIIEFNSKCAYCTRKVVKRQPGQIRLSPFTATLDHFYPKRRGGTHHMHNAVLACNSCNHQKADLHPFEFMAFVLPNLVKWDYKRHRNQEECIVRYHELCARNKRIEDDGRYFQHHAQNALIAQVVEQQSLKLTVVGSTPTEGATNNLLNLESHAI